MQVAATALVTWFLFRTLGIGLEEIRQLDSRWWRPRLPDLLLASGVLIVGYVMSGLLWGRMVRELGGPAMPARKAAGVHLTANLGRYVPGKIWQILGLVYLSRSVGASPAISSAAAVLGQALSLVGASAIGLLAARLAPPESVGPLVGLLGAVVLGGVVLASVPPVTRWALARWSRVLREDPGAISAAPGVGFGSRWGILYAVNWLVYAIAFWLFVRAYTDVSFLAAGPAFTAAYVMGYLFLPAPAGLGIREGALAGLLGPVLGVGAVAVAVTSRFWLTLIELVIALPFAVGELAVARKQEPAQTS